MLPSNTKATMGEFWNPERTKNSGISVPSPSGDLLLDWSFQINFFSVSIPEPQ